MNVKEAYEIITQKLTNKKVDKCYDYKTLFVFRMVPENYDGETPLIGDLFSVDKNTKLVKAFTPLMISIEDYRSGKEIRILKSEELKHHGVKGMKWGVRKDRNSSQHHKKRVSNSEKFKRSINRGRKKIKKWSRKKYSNIVLNTAAITSGALLIASAAITATPVSAISTTAWVTGHIAGIIERSLPDK